VSFGFFLNRDIVAHKKIDMSSRCDELNLSALTLATEIEYENDTEKVVNTGKRLQVCNFCNKTDINYTNRLYCSRCLLLYKHIVMVV
jgi:hypothetical protein